MVIGLSGCFAPPSDGFFPTTVDSMAPTYLPTRGPDREIGASPSFSSEERKAARQVILGNGKTPVAPLSPSKEV